MGQDECCEHCQKMTAVLKLLLHMLKKSLKHVQLLYGGETAECQKSRKWQRISQCLERVLGDRNGILSVNKSSLNRFQKFTVGALE